MRLVRQAAKTFGLDQEQLEQVSAWSLLAMPEGVAPDRWEVRRAQGLLLQACRLASLGGSQPAIYERPEDTPQCQKLAQELATQVAEEARLSPDEATALHLWFKCNSPEGVEEQDSKLATVILRNAADHVRGSENPTEALLMEYHKPVVRRPAQPSWSTVR